MHHVNFCRLRQMAGISMKSGCDAEDDGRRLDDDGGGFRAGEAQFLGEIAGDDGHDVIAPADVDADSGVHGAGRNGRDFALETVAQAYFSDLSLCDWSEYMFVAATYGRAEVDITIADAMFRLRGVYAGTCFVREECSHV